MPAMCFRPVLGIHLDVTLAHEETEAYIAFSAIVGRLLLMKLLATLV
jgi:hypothetical protein